jgi:hypothetical protein
VCSSTLCAACEWAYSRLSSRFRQIFLLSARPFRPSRRRSPSLRRRRCPGSSIRVRVGIVCQALDYAEKPSTKAPTASLLTASELPESKFHVIGEHLQHGWIASITFDEVLLHQTNVLVRFISGTTRLFPQSGYYTTSKHAPWMVYCQQWQSPIRLEWIRWNCWRN